MKPRLGGRLCHHHEPILLTFCVLDSCLSFLTDLRAPEPAAAAWTAGRVAECLWDSEDRAPPPRGVSLWEFRFVFPRAEEA